jgi:hypothetical protein
MFDDEASPDAFGQQIAAVGEDLEHALPHDAAAEQGEVDGQSVGRVGHAAEV